MRTIALFLMMTASMALSLPTYNVSTDIRKTTQSWEVKYVFTGTTPIIRQMLYEGTSPYRPTSTNVVAVMWYGTNSNWESTNNVQITGAVSTNLAYIDYAASNGSFPLSGTFYGGFRYSDGSSILEWGLGKVFVRASGGVTGDGTLFTTNSFYADFVARGIDNIRGYPVTASAPPAINYLLSWNGTELVWKSDSGASGVTLQDVTNVVTSISVLTTRILSINGVAYSLDADRSWTITDVARATTVTGAQSNLIASAAQAATTVTINGEAGTLATNNVWTIAGGISAATATNIAEIVVSTQNLATVTYVDTATRDIVTNIVYAAGSDITRVGPTISLGTNDFGGGDPVDARAVTNNINLAGFSITNGVFIGDGSGLTGVTTAAAWSEANTNYSRDAANLTNMVGNSTINSNILKVGYTEALVHANSSVVSNTLKISYTDAALVSAIAGTQSVNQATLDTALQPVSTQGLQTASQVTSIVNAASSVPYAIPYAATVTVNPANGWKQSIDATNDMTITFAGGSADTDTLLMVTLWASTNSITLGTNNVFGTNHTAMVWPAPPPTNQPLIISMQNPMFTTNWTATWHIGSTP